MPLEMHGHETRPDPDHAAAERQQTPSAAWGRVLHRPCGTHETSPEE